MKINDLLALQHVPRWSIVPHVGTQTVADHTFGMMVIAIELATRLEMELSNSCLVYALLHDGPESRSGDIPSGAKRKIEDAIDMSGGAVDRLFDDGELGDFEVNMTVNELAVVRLADKIEGYLFIQKWGVGIHARKVSTLCLREVHAIANQHSIKMGEVVTNLLVELSMEEGR